MSRTYENAKSDDLIKVTDPDLDNGFCILTKAELEKHIDQAHAKYMREKKEAIQREIDSTTKELGLKNA